MLKKNLYLTAIFAFLILFTAFATVFSAPAEGSKADIIDLIIQKSGIPEQAAMIPTLFQDVNAKQEEETARSSEIDAIFQAGFAAENIIAEIKQTFLNRYDEKNAREVLKFYDSELGKKIVKSEIDAARPDFPQKMAGFDIENYDKKRRQVITRLFDDMETMEFQSELQSIVMEMIFRSANAVMPKKSRMSDEAVIDMWKKFKSEMNGEDSGDGQRTSILAMFYVTYENITTGELEKYDKFLNSKPGKWYNQISQTGFINALKKGAARVIQDLMDYTDKHPGVETGENGDEDNIGDV